MTLTIESTDLVARAAALAPELRERAAEGEALRTMPADLVATLKRAGLFRLALAETLGGWEAAPLTIFETIEELGRADGSAAWTAFIANTGLLLAWLEPDAARGLLEGDPDRPVAGTFAPLGRAVPTGDGFVVSGRWPCASGALHSELVMGGVLVMDGDAPRFVGDRPDWRFAWFRRDDVAVIDTWHAPGLRGTGSHDIAVDAVYVPAEHTCSPMFEPARIDRPLFRLSMYNLLAPLVTGFAAGVGRAAVDRFVEIAQTKRRGIGPTVCDDEYAQIVVAQADLQLRAARSLFVDAIGDAWDTVTRGDACAPRQRAAVIGAQQLILKAGLNAVDTLLPFAGASSVRDDEPLQRAARDLHAARQHIVFSADAMKRVGRVAFGLEPNDYML
ncbi:MAG TPA: acyl-CoA dehydrogenase family protein [Acidimicrobiales bacterium]|nr:acyl-CoA dehydrogenase family protein [Acidimicrobiales bacterium]